MITVEMPVTVGTVQVRTTDHRGWSTDELAQRAADRIVYVGEQSHPLVREQARAFKDRVQAVVAFYLKEAVKQDRTTVANRLTQVGHPELVRLLED